MSKSGNLKTIRKGKPADGTVRIAVCSAVLAVIIVLASVAPLRSAADWGADNYVMIPQNSSSDYFQIAISSTLTASNAYTGPAFTCSYQAQWSEQWNILDASELNNAWIQVAVTVNPSGDSCFILQYWPSYYGGTSDWYDFNIGYSSEFINSGNTIQFALDASSWQISDFRVSVPSDSWTIHTYQLYPNAPAVKYAGDSEANTVIVGCCFGANAWFTGGSGTIYYHYSGWVGTDRSITGESSNMGYNSLTKVNSETWDQTFVHCGTCI